MKSGNHPYVDIPHASRGCMRLAWYGGYIMLTMVFIGGLADKRGTALGAWALAFVFLIGCGELLWWLTLRGRKKRMIKTQRIIPLPARPADPDDDVIVLKPVAPTEKLHR